VVRIKTGPKLKRQRARSKRARIQRWCVRSLGTFAEVVIIEAKSCTTVNRRHPAEAVGRYADNHENRTRTKLGPQRKVLRTKSPALESTLSQALALHQVGRLAEAEKSYLQIVKRNPMILIVCTCLASFLFNEAIMRRRSVKSTLR
jgi:hypothetical protein